MVFYTLLGFRKTAELIGPEPVVNLEHGLGLELNLVCDAPNVQYFAP